MIIDGVIQETSVTGEKKFENSSSFCIEKISLLDFLNEEIPKRENILTPIIPEQGLAMIYAARGIGKTFVAMNIGYAVASGGNFLGWKSDKPSGVLYLDGEMPACVLQERFANITVAAEKDVIEKFEIITNDKQVRGMLDLANSHWRRELESHLDGIKLIIVDNISTLCRNGRENEADSWIPIQEWALLQRASGRSVLFVHHSGKGGNQRGTSKREDVLDTVINLRRPADYESSQGAKFEVHYDKCRGFYGEDAEPFEAQLMTDVNSLSYWNMRTLQETTSERVVALLNDGLSQKDIAIELNVDKSTVSRHAKKAKVNGKVSI